MQTTTTSGYSTNVQAAFRTVGYGLQIAWQRVINPSTNFFTIGTSLIGGADIIKSGGSFVAFFDKYQFTDYASYVINWSVQRKLGQYPYGTILAQADVQLDNSSGLFTPGYDVTIGSGILPNRPMKISTSIGNESISQFVGFNGQPELSITQRTMTLHAFDAMDYIQNYSFTTSGTTTSGVVTTTSGFLVNVRADQAFQYYLQQLGFSNNQFVLDQGLQANIGYIPVIDNKLGKVFNDIVEAEQGLLFVDETGIVRFWNRQHFLTTSGVSQFQLNYNNLVSLEYENTSIINDVIVTARPRSVQVKQKIWELAGAKEIPAGQSVAIFADFTDSFGVLPATSIDTPLYISLAVTSSFSTNTSADSTGTSSVGQLTLTSVYLFGSSYKMVFKNTNANSIFVTTLSLYGTPARVTTQIQQRFLDQTSIDNYGRNPSNNGMPLQIDNDLIQDPSSAYSLAYSIVIEYKDARRRYKASVFPRPELQIGDWGQLTVADANNETKNVFIVGIQTQMAGQPDYKQILWLEERTPKSYFTIGTSLIQGTDGIAP